MEAIDSVFQNAVQQLNVVFQANALAHFVQMFFTHTGAEFGIVKKQVGKLRSLLHQVQFCHAFRLALELRGGNSDQLAQDIARVVESQGLVKVAGENIPLKGTVAHMTIRFTSGAEDKLKTLMAAISAQPVHTGRQTM